MWVAYLKTGVTVTSDEVSFLALDPAEVADFHALAGGAVLPLGRLPLAYRRRTRLTPAGPAVLEVYVTEDVIHFMTDTQHVVQAHWGDGWLCKPVPLSVTEQAALDRFPVAGR